MFQNNCAKVSNINSKNNHIAGEITIPGDKSISHRSIMLGAIAEGDTRIKGFLKSADCLATLDCFRRLGVEIEENPGEIVIHGVGLHGLKRPETVLDVKNSGTSIRLLSGILCGSGVDCEITGDASIRKRPMGRIIKPLRLMGADIRSRDENDCAPLLIRGGELHGIDYESQVASAQVKSCVLFAGLYADSDTRFTEPEISRDHTERMLKSFGADIRVDKNVVELSPGGVLKGREIDVPGDISSAAYFIAAALIVPGSELVVKNVGINPTRAGMLEVAKNMGADITYANERTVSGEPVADIIVKYSRLHGVDISGKIIPTLIDEIPILAVLAAYAEGETRIADARELKVKESDRILSVCENLSAMGADATPTDDGMIIRGARPLKDAVIKCYHDHRIAMSFYVAGLNTPGTMLFDDARCVDISYPEFFSDMSSVFVNGK